MKKILLLDLDGTIRETISGKTFINDPLDQKPINGATFAIDYYHRSGWKIIGITNQAGVAAGHKSLENAINEQSHTLNMFPHLDSIYLCPDFKGEECYRVSRSKDWPEQVHSIRSIDDEHPELIGTFRKPNPGMIRAALLDLNGLNTDDDCLLVGDRIEDEEAASNAGIRFLGADKWRANL